MPTTMEIEEDNIEEIISAKDQAIEDALLIIGAKAEKYAKGLCPTGSEKTTGIKGYIGGTLKNSITYTTKTKSGNTVSVEADNADPLKKMHGGKKETVENGEEQTMIIGTNVFYAPYVENGTSRGMDPRPFIKPALQDHRSEYEHIMINEVKKVGA